MELLTTPWNIILYSALCFAASFLVFRIRDGLFLWLAAAVIVIPVGSYFAKLTTLMALGGFVAGSGASLLLFIWLGNRKARQSVKRADGAG